MFYLDFFFKPRLKEKWGSPCLTACKSRIYHNAALHLYTFLSAEILILAFALAAGKFSTNMTVTAYSGTLLYGYLINAATMLWRPFFCPSESPIHFLKMKPCWQQFQNKPTTAGIPPATRLYVGGYSGHNNQYNYAIVNKSQFTSEIDATRLKMCISEFPDFEILQGSMPPDPP